MSDISKPPLLSAVTPNSTSTPPGSEPTMSEEAATAEMPDLSAINPEEMGQMALLMTLMQTAQVALTTPGVQAMLEAQAKRVGAAASLEAAKAETEAELNKMREQFAHQRAMDAQKAQWEITARRDLLAVILLSVWTCVGVGVLAAAVYAIYAKVIDSQTAVTLGVVLASVLAAATARLTNRPMPQSPTK